MFTYKWIIENFEVQNSDTLENIATKIKWRYVAYISDNMEVGSEHDTLLLDEPDLQNFTQFEELTEEIVISWLQTKLSVQDLQTAIEMRYHQNNNILEDEQVNKNITLPPWNS
jgi:hypothetical protein